MDSIILAKQIRRRAVLMTSKGKSSHIGSALSAADILAVLYADVLKYDTQNPEWVDRDRFIFSKGHAVSALYATLVEVGMAPESVLESYSQDGSVLCGHVSKGAMPGIELSTGSLGHGLPVGCGMALSAKTQGKDFKTYVLMGDGECDEGSIWEAALFASHRKLNNLTVIIDRNHLQSIHTTEETLNLEPFADKWQSFGWDVNIINGHDHPALLTAFNDESNAPKCIIAETTKGKGVSFMENQVAWHYKFADGDLLKQALAELEK